MSGVAHHVTQRGNNRQDGFFIDDDHRVYLAMFKRCSEAYGLSIIGYCLMTNHMHPIAAPATEDALAKAVWRTHCFHTQYANRFPHACDIASGIRQDTNGNGVPDERERQAQGGGPSPAPGGNGAAVATPEALAAFNDWRLQQQWGLGADVGCAQQFQRCVDKLPELGLPPANPWRLVGEHNRSPVRVPSGPLPHERGSVRAAWRCAGVTARSARATATLAWPCGLPATVASASGGIFGDDLRGDRH